MDGLLECKNDRISFTCSEATVHATMNTFSSYETGETDDHRKYVFAMIVDNEFPTLVVLTPTRNGWRTRSTRRAYNHDYVCYETFGEVMSWIDAELQRSFIAADRTDALKTLLTDNTSEHRTGYLYPGGVVPGSVEEAEIVIRHLECGW